MDNDFIARIGTFFLLVSFGFLTLFVASDFAKQPQFDYFFIGLILIVIGFLFRRRATPPASSGRFSGVRKILSRNKKEENKDEEETEENV